MNNRYKIIISNDNLYKEIELSREAKQIKIGTTIDCDVRLRKELFFEDIEIKLLKNEGKWTIYCSDNLYFTIGDVRKLVTKNLNHGDFLEVKYQKFDNLIFSIDYFIDFDDGKTKYERKINIAPSPLISIGSNPRSNIVLNSEYLKDDEIHLIKQKNKFILQIVNTSYGVEVNGQKAKNNMEIKNLDFISMADYFFYLKDGILYTQIRNDMRINGLEFYDKSLGQSYPKFNRNTRVKTVVCEDEIEVLDPPAKPKKPKNNVWLRLLPALGMLVAAGVMATMGGVTMLIMSGISGTMAVVTTVLGVRESKKEFKQSTQDRIDKYNLYIGNKRNQIQQCRNQEREELEQIYISQQKEVNQIINFSSDLFDRNRSDEDFLSLRLGLGNIPSRREIKYKKQERLEIEDDLQLYPERICEEFKNLNDAPIVCKLNEINALGIVGNENNVLGFFKTMIMDLVVRQFSKDINIVLVADKKHRKEVERFRFLPHMFNETLGIRNIVTDDDSKNIIFEYLYKELTTREENKNYDKNLVVCFLDEYGFKNHPISKFVSKAKDLGITFIFFADIIPELPQGCNYLIDIKTENQAVYINSENKTESYPFMYTSLKNIQVEDFVKILAPIYTEEISLEGSLTKNISMFELLDIYSVEDINLSSQWNSSEVYKSMAAPIGVTKNNVVYLDLHDKAHGPHGLVAGTTGSGKSEILQTYILSMATLFHPYEVGFVIIDFKGGGMVNQFKNLPHLLGAITNIDGKEINRSLKSIKAELQKRQRYFADADVNHIDKYIKKYKAGKVSEPLPHLIIIVDEFAELKAEQPDFMKELISAARIGRSLGVHLILATQKPAGQVNDQIWSNSRFKLCLKVQSQEDSNEVLKSPLAAEIKEPGRAYLQVGNNEIFELFQSAYSGAPEKMDNSNEKEFTIYNLTRGGKRVPIFQQKKKKKGKGSITQLDAIVQYVSNYCETKHISKLPNICLPSLKENIPFLIENSYKSGHFSAEIGLFDDPENQFQGTYSIDLESNNVLMIGSSQMGKTNILQDMIRSLSTKYSPEEVSIYVIDFASMILKNFDKLNHVGGVVCPNDDEKLKNLFKLLTTEIEIRKEKMMSVGVSSFSAYREAGRDDLPFIVLMIDNLTALKELYFQDDDDAILNLCREGLTVGISVVISNVQTTGIGYRYLSSFSERIALFCNDVNEYTSLFDHIGEKIDPIPGRCIIRLENKCMDCQAYLAFEGEKEFERVQEIRKYVQEVNKIYGRIHARKIPLIPAVMTEEYMIDQFDMNMSNPYSIVTGLDYGNVEPVSLDLANAGLIAVTGKEASGKHNWIKYIVHMLDSRYKDKSKVYIIDGINRKMKSIQGRSNVCSYSMLLDDAVNNILEIEQQLQERYEKLAAGDESVLNDSELLMMVIDNLDAIDAICNNPKALNAYKNIMGRYKNLGVCMFVFIENANISYSAPEILKNIRDQRQLMYFDDVANMKMFDFPLSIMRMYKKPIETGDGYYIKGGDIMKLKTPLAVADKPMN